MIDRLSIQNRLALVLWGSILFAFVTAGIGLLVYQNLTLEQRALEIMQPYAQLVSVGTGAAVAFQDPDRAQEVLDTLRANPHIQEAEIYLEDGRIFASFRHQSTSVPQSPPVKEDGVYISPDRAVLLQRLPSGARLRISMGRAQLNEQTQQTLWIFGAGVFILLFATLSQVEVLRRMIVRPIATLTEAAEHVRVSADYERRVPAKGGDEVARLGQSFNAMMEAIQEKQKLLLEAQSIAHLSNWWHDLITDEIYWSDEFFHMLGCEPHRPTAEEGKKWIHPDDLPMLEQAMERSLSSEQEQQQEFRIIRADGEVRWIHSRWKSVFDQNGSEIKRIGTYQDITERKSAEESLRHLNRELRAVSECNQVLVRAEDEQTLVESICRIVCDEAGYRMAWVGYAERDDAKSLRLVGRAGVGAGYLEQTQLTWADTEYGQGPSGSAIRSGKIEVVDHFDKEVRVAPWHDAALRFEYRSSIALPLIDEKRQTFGVFSIYSSEAGAFSDTEQRLLEELAGDLSFGIVTLRARAEHDRAEEQIRVAATAFEAQEGIIITDADERILRVNRAFSEITGYSMEEVLGATPRLLKSDYHDSAYFKEMWETIRNNGSWLGEIWNRHKNGKLYPAWMSIKAVKNPHGEITHYVGTMTDITERKDAEKKIQHLAFYDLLTDLPNRRLLMDRLQQAMRSCARSERMGALLFIDLDNFKLLNDTCGHDTGDQLLVAVARRLAACTREGDTISRLGGDEFIVMLGGLSGSPSVAANQTKRVGEKVLSLLNRPYNMADRVHHSTPSIGATLFTGREKSVDELLKQADIAMYQAKMAGRNTLRFFDPEMQAGLAVRADTEAALRSSIAQRDFILHYQAQVDDQNRIIGAEVLLRWRHPEYGLMFPADFVPLAEETDLILPLGQWVLENACRQLAVWSRKLKFRDMVMAVNVSALQFRQDDFVSKVSQALAKTGAPANHLKLELTESLVLGDIEDSIDKMRALKAIGVGFSMDDFGTGYSSLSYLTRLPLDQLKIDRTFVKNLPENANDAVVVQTIITLAQSLGLTVVAEGVETEVQREFLERHGCPVFQGYLFAKPMDLGSFESWRISWRF